MFRHMVLAALVAAGLVSRSVAQPGGQITSPGPPPFYPQYAEYGLTGSPTSQTDSSDPHNYYLQPPMEGSQILANWVFFRTAVDSVQYPFGNYVKSNGYNITGTSVWPSGGAGNTAVYNWTDYGPPSGGAVFSAIYTMVLTNGPQTPDARLKQSLQITNPNSTPLTISLYNAMVPYPGGTSTIYTSSGGLGNILATDGAYDVTFSATGATAYEADTTGTLGALLYGGPATDLNDSGIPATTTHDNPVMLLAMEWTETIPADSAITISSAISISQAVPEPATLALCGVAAGMAAALRLPKRLKTGTR